MTTNTTTLTQQQLAFLADLRRGARRASADIDAGVVGPLIRANLVRWDDDPGEATRRRSPPSSMFTLADLGARRLAEHEASCSLPE